MHSVPGRESVQPLAHDAETVVIEPVPSLMLHSAFPWAVLLCSVLQVPWSSLT